MKGFFRILSIVLPGVILWVLSGNHRLGIAWIALTLLGAVLVRSIGLSRLLRAIDFLSHHLPFGKILFGPILRSARIAAEVLPSLSHPEARGGLFRRAARLLEESTR